MTPDQALRFSGQRIYQTRLCPYCSECLLPPTKDGATTKCPNCRSTVKWELLMVALPQEQSQKIASSADMYSAGKAHEIRTGVIDAGE